MKKMCACIDWTHQLVFWPRDREGATTRTLHLPPTRGVVGPASERARPEHSFAVIGSTLFFRRFDHGGGHSDLRGFLRPQPGEPAHGGRGGLADGAGGCHTGVWPVAGGGGGLSLQRWATWLLLAGLAWKQMRDVRTLFALPREENNYRGGILWRIFSKWCGSMAGYAKKYGVKVNN